MLRSKHLLLSILLCVTLLVFGGYSDDDNKDGDPQTVVVDSGGGWKWSYLFVLPAALDGVCYLVRAVAGDTKCEGVESGIKIKWTCRDPWTCADTKHRCQQSKTENGVIIITYQVNDRRRRLLHYDNEPSPDFVVFNRDSIPMTALCWDDPICSDMLINYNFISNSEQARCTEFGCNGDELLLFQQSVDEIAPLVCSATTNPPCDDNNPDIGKTCDSNDDCSDCLRCCSVKKKCEIPPASKSELIQHDIDDNKMDFVEPKVEEKKRFYEYPIFGYISYAGFIAFILINNVFIGYWCCFKRNDNKNKYEKCEIVTVNDE